MTHSTLQGAGKKAPLLPAEWGLPEGLGDSRDPGMELCSALTGFIIRTFLEREACPLGSTTFLSVFVAFLFFPPA